MLDKLEFLAGLGTRFFFSGVVRLDIREPGWLCRSGRNIWLTTVRFWYPSVTVLGWPYPDSSGESYD